MYVFPSKHFKRNNLNFYFRNKTGGQPAIGWAHDTTEASIFRIICILSGLMSLHTDFRVLGLSSITNCP